MTHRELAREGLEAAYLTDRPEPRTGSASEICAARLQQPRRFRHRRPEATT